MFLQAFILALRPLQNMTSHLNMVSHLITHWYSTFLTRNTTGTDVQGIIPISVITMETKSEGVTSYIKFKRLSESTCRQLWSVSEPDACWSGIRSSGSPWVRLYKVYSQAGDGDHKWCCNFLVNLVPRVLIWVRGCFLVLHCLETLKPAWHTLNWWGGWLICSGHDLPHARPATCCHAGYLL